jgi:hypothetical protein
VHPDTKQVAEHMKDFGFHILGRAISDAIFDELLSPFAHILSIVHAAHGAEILIKARIAQEHPLLVFSSYPKSKTTSSLLTIKELFEHGKTLTYSELPEVLWATTGYRIYNLADFQKFGALRNGLVHFAAPNFNAADETLRFAFEVLDPIVRDFWNESFVKHSEYCDEGIIEGGHLREGITRLGLSIHPDTKREIEEREKRPFEERED